MKNRLEYIDLLRVFFCIAILTYHIGYLKGGYLAVCSFFVLSGYLSGLTFKKENFSIINYYKSRFLRIYLPMLFVTLFTVSLYFILLPNDVWVSMKREVTSLLLGYNNFWQLSANMDYFARHIDSPFMHLWYVSILLQLELLFPLIYGLFKFLQKKLHKCVPIILAFLIGLSSIGLFIFVHNEKGLMYAYYNTFTRCFAWFIGLALGMLFLNKKQKTVSIKKKSNVSLKILFFFIIIGQSVLFVFAASDSKLYLGSMLATTFIACGLIALAQSFTKPLIPGIRQIIRFLSNISYEVFLVQYPVIYLIQYAKLPVALTNVLIVTATLVAAALLHMFIQSLKEYTPVLIFKFLIFFVLIAGASYGAYKYISSPDLQAELERLEEELAKKEEEQLIKQQEYEQKLKEEEEARKKKEEELKRQEEELKKQLEEAKADIDRQLELIDKQEQEIKDSINSLPICFVGDSVLLGASEHLYEVFPNCYIDAQISRTAYVINPIFVDLINRNLLGDIVVINCGANGDCPNEIKDEIMNTLSGKQVFWLTCTNNNTANETLFEYASLHDNLHIIDWKAIAENHSEYLTPDGIHLQQEGIIAYTDAIFNSIYEYYISDLEEQRTMLENKKQELID